MRSRITRRKWSCTGDRCVQLHTDSVLFLIWLESKAASSAMPYHTHAHTSHTHIQTKHTHRAPRVVVWSRMKVKKRKKSSRSSSSSCSSSPRKPPVNRLRGW